MRQRGRQSSAALALVASNPVELVEKPRPPEDLSDEQKEEWVAITSRLPADWFGRETHAMLAQYCRHIVASKRVAQLIAAAEADEDFDLRDYDRLLKMQEREGRAITSLATKMRISQQSTYDKSKKKPGAMLKPWDG